MLTPLGCPPVDLVAPQHALEVTYAKGSLPGVALLLEFDDSATAQRFFETHSTNLEACSQRNNSPVLVRGRSPSRMEYRRTEASSKSLSWEESIKVQGDRVLFVARADQA